MNKIQRLEKIAAEFEANGDTLSAEITRGEIKGLREQQRQHDLRMNDTRSSYSTEPDGHEAHVLAGVAHKCGCEIRHYVLENGVEKRIY